MNNHLWKPSIIIFCAVCCRVYGPHLAPRTEKKDRPCNVAYHGPASRSLRYTNELTVIATCPSWNKLQLNWMRQDVPHQLLSAETALHRAGPGQRLNTEFQ